MTKNLFSSEFVMKRSARRVSLTLVAAMNGSDDVNECGMGEQSTVG